MWWLCHDRRFAHIDDYFDKIGGLNMPQNRWSPDESYTFWLQTQSITIGAKYILPIQCRKICKILFELVFLICGGQSAANIYEKIFTISVQRPDGLPVPGRSQPGLVHSLPWCLSSCSGTSCVCCCARGLRCNQSRWWSGRRPRAFSPDPCRKACRSICKDSVSPVFPLNR